MKKRRRMLAASCLVLLLAVSGCKGKETEKQEPSGQQTETAKNTEQFSKADADTETGVAMEPEADADTETGAAMEPEADTETETGMEVPQETEHAVQPLDETVYTTAEVNAGTGIVYPASNGHIVCIDAGHQLKGDSTPEPVAPGASETKARVTSGTTGRTTGVAEYQLTLQVSLKLRDELIARGYGVVMTRETNEVNLSNSERAGIAANAGADSFVRIHANGSEDSTVSGAMTICQTSGNPYVGSCYSQSKALSECILDAFCAATGANKQYVWETDTMSGINWSSMPVTILEMGYMTNPTEDTNMSTEDYQNKMVQGIANGIDNYYAGN